MKRFVVLAALGALVVGVVNVSASQASHTLAATIYGDTDYTCDAGATDTFGPTFGTFVATVGDSHWVSASVTVHGLHTFQLYDLAVIESGHSCLTADVVTFYANSRGQAIVQFRFWRHTGETSAWITVEGVSTFDVYRSTSLPIKS
jgi:hypothetical protein